MTTKVNYADVKDRPHVRDARAVAHRSISEQELQAGSRVTAAHIVRLQSGAGAILIFEFASGELARLRTKNNDSERKFSLETAMQFAQDTQASHAMQIFVHRSVEALNHQSNPRKGTL